MEERCKTFDQITLGASDCLKKKRSRSDGTIRHYNVLWRKVKRYMEFNEIKHFESKVGKDYLLQEYGSCDYSKLSKHDKDIVRGVNVLCEFQETGSLLPVKEQTVFDGPIGQLMIKYLSYKISLRLNKHTIDEKEQHLYRFLCYLNKHGITSVNAINQLHVLYFIKGIDPRYSTLPHMTMRTLRGFFSYLYDQSMLDVDLSCLIPKDKFHKQAKLPSVYSPKEIEAMLTSIDRGNANGKRNYAIVMLAARLGLRASDIANLRFENLQWERCAIRFNQYKTGKVIELPMLPEVGNAIVDYLRYGRPKSEESFVFLLSRSPYTPIHSGAITGIVHSSLVQAGINIDNRKHGSHVLRHSLAGILLEKGTILPIISEVLGHKNTESTKYYLRIDLNSLRKCTIEVPPVRSSFYGQKGGYFYE
ncbi:MAG: tyrosine-type recombinase/integrase [Deltaproteobacteria bacterium]|nr:tyrosine-type recombinase/integrase [Deltaproteobacteria bacterium]